MQQTPTIQSLQSYILQLTAYLNENNEKYTRNLQTLKQFYQSQIDQLHSNHASLEEQILSLKNQNIVLRDVKMNKDREIGELKGKIGECVHENREIEARVRAERARNQEVYRHVDEIRGEMQARVDREVQRVRAVEDQKSKLLITINQKQSSIKTLKNQIASLQDKVAERYTMPQRMKDLEIQSAKDKTMITNLQQKVAQLTKQRDFSQTQLQKKRKQNQKLQIQANKSKGDLSFQIQMALKNQREAHSSQLQALKLDNERKIYQIQSLQQSLSQTRSTLQKMQSTLSQLAATKEQLTQQLQQYKSDKQIYLGQFRKLKGQYEAVIDSLENAIPQYQKKIWKLQQENQDLNEQLDGLKELLREVKAINDMEPFRKEYRHWAELQLMADKKLPEQLQSERKENKENKQNSFMVRKGDEELSPDWQKLLMDLQKIQV